MRRTLLRLSEQVLRGRLRLPESIGDAARKIIDVLLFISEESTADRHDLFRPFILPVLEECSAIASSRIASRTLSALPQYCSFFRNALQSVVVPFPGTPLHGLQVLGFLETRNLQFDRVFLLDANDDVLPGTPGVDVLLPQGIRAALGLPVHRMPSGAGHDAVTMSRVCPVAMLFVRCKGGISHNPAESVEVEDVAVSIEVLTNILLAISERSGTD